MRPIQAAFYSADSQEMQSPCIKGYKKLLLEWEP